MDGGPCATVKRDKSHIQYSPYLRISKILSTSTLVGENTVGKTRCDPYDYNVEGQGPSAYGEIIIFLPYGTV